MSTSPAPAGFHVLDDPSPHLAHIGPVWSRTEPTGAPTYGLRIDDHHLNNRGTAHGGVVATLADITCGYAFRSLVAPGQPPPALTTTHLATTYLASAAPGNWLEATGAIIRLGRAVAASTAVLAVDGRLVAHATALFHVAGSSMATPGRQPGEVG